MSKSKERFKKSIKGEYKKDGSNIHHPLKLLVPEVLDLQAIDVVPTEITTMKNRGFEKNNDQIAESKLLAKLHSLEKKLKKTKSDLKEQTGVINQKDDTISTLEQEISKIKVDLAAHKNAELERLEEERRRKIIEEADKTKASNELRDREWESETDSVKALLENQKEEYLGDFRYPDDQDKLKVHISEEIDRRKAEEIRIKEENEEKERREREAEERQAKAKQFGLGVDFARGRRQAFSKKREEEAKKLKAEEEKKRLQREQEELTRKAEEENQKQRSAELQARTLQIADQRERERIAEAFDTEIKTADSVNGLFELVKIRLSLDESAALGLHEQMCDYIYKRKKFKNEKLAKTAFFKKLDEFVKQFERNVRQASEIKDWEDVNRFIYLTIIQNLFKYSKDKEVALQNTLSENPSGLSDYLPENLIQQLVELKQKDVEANSKELNSQDFIDFIKNSPFLVDLRKAKQENNKDAFIKIITGPLRDELITMKKNVILAFNERIDISDIEELSEFADFWYGN